MDHALCPGALACGRCLEACGEGVLMTAPDKGGVYRVRVALSHRCTRCGRCLEACPAAAIRGHTLNSKKNN